ncbi:glucose-1-phosphate thymidylyltransferase [Patescibacteria group bacterium]|nr:glucose-1-phosphate thymidylyltransferase [Patescibacteria group bacterium]MBU1921825.1 glucose-1-phosphate thymidylyltransferase [Patescibacteria group bacterium]
MKALITAGGRATRLRPITWTINKHLIPLANKPMIFNALEKVAAAGIKEVAININVGDRELPQAIGDGSRWGLKITYIEQKGGALGLAHIIKNAEDWLGKDDLLFYLGDNIILGGINKFVEKFKSGGYNCLLALSRVPDPQRFGVPVIENGRIVRVEEKPSEPKSDFAVTGIYVYDNHILEAVSDITPGARGEYEISDAHTWLIEHGYKVGYEEITGWWKDTGKPEDLLEGNQLLLNEMKQEDFTIESKVGEGVVVQGRVKIGKNCNISEKVLIRGPVIIGNNCSIKNSYIGPYACLGNEVEIYNTEIEHSIVFDLADINCSKRIVDSLIGKNAAITSVHDSLPQGHKLVIGDNTVVEL